MARNILRRERDSAGERDVVPAGGAEYFAGEVIRILGLDRLNYDQLQRLFDVVRGQALPARQSGGWRRYNFSDLVALKVAAKLLGAETGKALRLRLRNLERVCAHLRMEFGLKNPLLEATLCAHGSAILVELEGTHFDATTRQVVIAEVVASVAKYERVQPGVSPRAVPQSQRVPGGPRRARSYQTPALALSRRPR